MEETRLVLPPEDIACLQMLGGAQWISLSSPSLASAALAWECVVISTSHCVVEIALRRKSMIIDGDLDDYPALSARRYESTVGMPNAETKSLFYGKDESIREIRVLRESIVGHRSSLKQFSYVADVSVAFDLDTQWIAVTRTSHNVDAFRIQIQRSMDQISFPESEFEWPSTLLDQFEIQRQWVKIWPSEI